MSFPPWLFPFLVSFLLTIVHVNALHVHQPRSESTVPLIVTATVTEFAYLKSIYLSQDSLSLSLETPPQLPPKKTETVPSSPAASFFPVPSDKTFEATWYIPITPSTASSSATTETSNLSLRTTPAPNKITETPKETFNPSDLPRVELSSVSSTWIPHECNEDGHCVSRKQKCSDNQTAVCQRAARTCQCVTPEPISSPSLTPTFVKNKRPTETEDYTSTKGAASTEKQTSTKAPYSEVTDGVMDRKIELERQHCHNPSSYPEEGVIDGNELWSDARDICESLKGAGKRVSVEYSGFGSNGKGENGSKQHFAIWWKENCEFKSKERMGYGMKAYDPFENDETIEGESRCTMLLVENWKSCLALNNGKGGYRDVGCLRYFTGPGAKFSKVEGGVAIKQGTNASST